MGDGVIIIIILFFIKKLTNATYDRPGRPSTNDLVDLTFKI